MAKVILVLSGHDASVSALAWSPQGGLLASASFESDEPIRLWDVDNGEEALTLSGDPAGVVSVAFSPDGRTLASLGGEGAIKVCDTKSGKARWTALTRSDKALTGGIAFSPDASRIVATGQRDVKEWRAATGELIRSLSSEKRPFCVTYSPDGKSILSGSEDGSLAIWDASSGETVRVLRSHQAMSEAIVFEPDGTRFVSASADRTVRVWDASSWESLLILRTDDEKLRSLAISPDGSRILAGGRKLHLWETTPPAESYAARAGYAAIRREADSILGSEDSLVADFIDRVKAHGELSKPVREAAIALANLRGKSPLRLNELSWTLVRSPDAGQENFQRGLRMAQAACRASPGNGLILNTLGVAQFRVGEYEKALETLKQSDDLNSASDTKSGSPADVAFIAMSLYQFGRADEARAAMERLRSVMQDPRYANDDESQGFFREAESLIFGAPTSQPVREE